MNKRILSSGSFLGAFLGLLVLTQFTGPSPVNARIITNDPAADGSCILPAYLSDNYFPLFPGESREIDIDYPASAAQGSSQLTLRGWNLPTQTIPMAPPK